jgi:hypothetical protein
MKMYKERSIVSDGRRNSIDGERTLVPTFGYTRLMMLAALAAIGIANPLPAWAQNQRTREAQVERKLVQRAVFSWRGQSLGSALIRLSETQAIPLWIDRRIDVAAPLDLEIRDATVGEALNRIAAPQQAAATPFRGIVYFGPATTGGELATLAARLKLSVGKLPAEHRQKWLTAAPWSFPRLSQPRELLDQLAAGVGAKVVGAEQIPHDLWGAQELPTLSAIDRVVLLLAGFDLTGEIADDGAVLRVVPIERPVAVERHYAPPPPRRAAFDAALAAVPDAVVQWNGPRATIAARVEVHNQLQLALVGRLPRPTAPPTVRPPADSVARQAYTLKIENRPLAAVLDQLARQANVEVVWAEDISAEARAAPTSCDVRNATLDELLTALVKPAGLTFKRTDRRVEVRRQE